MTRFFVSVFIALFGVSNLSWAAQTRLTCGIGNRKDALKLSRDKLVKDKYLAILLKEENPEEGKELERLGLKDYFVSLDLNGSTHDKKARLELTLNFVDGSTVRTSQVSALELAPEDRIAVGISRRGGGSVRLSCFID